MHSRLRGNGEKKHPAVAFLIPAQAGLHRSMFR